MNSAQSESVGSFVRSERKELPRGLTRDEVIAKIAPDNGPPVHAKGDVGLVGLFVNPWRQ
jgi:hypothetical protein